MPEPHDPTSVDAKIKKRPGYQRLEGAEKLLLERGPFIKRFQDKMQTYEVVLSYLDGMDFHNDVEEIVTSIETAKRALAENEETKSDVEWMDHPNVYGPGIRSIRASEDPLKEAKFVVRDLFLRYDAKMGELMKNVEILIEEADKDSSKS